MRKYISAGLSFFKLKNFRPRIEKLIFKNKSKEIKQRSKIHMTVFKPINLKIFTSTYKYTKFKGKQQPYE